MTESLYEPLELSGYQFIQHARFGCSSLVQVKKCGASEEEFSGKLIPNDKMSEFLSLEGTVQKVLRTYPHQNILQPVSIVNGKDISGIVFPSLGEDVHTYARARKGIPEREAKLLFHSIVTAVHHCHKHRIVLRDLRVGKIFFAKKGASTEVVIGDLDGAQLVPHADPFLSDRKGSPAFVSPEVVVSHIYDGAAADMWALGVILFILLTGSYPFRDSHPANLFHKIQQGHSAVSFPHTMSEAARDVIRSLLVKEAHLRLTAEQLLADLWFTSIPLPSRSDLSAAGPARPAPAQRIVAATEKAFAPTKRCPSFVGVLSQAPKRLRSESTDTESSSPSPSPELEADAADQ